MYSFYFLLFISLSSGIVADPYTNDCSIRSKDYLVIANTDYQPTSPLLMFSQLTVMSLESCASVCLANVICITATFQIGIGQCVIYFEDTVNGQLTPFSGRYVLSVTKHNFGKNLDSCEKFGKLKSG